MKQCDLDCLGEETLPEGPLADDWQEGCLSGCDSVLTQLGCFDEEEDDASLVQEDSGDACAR